MARKILKVGDIRKISEQTIMIGGGYVGDEEDNFNPKSIIGKQILIEGEKNRTRTKVLDVNYSSSLIGKRNIFILISVDMLDSIQEGDSVFID